MDNKRTIFSGCVSGMRDLNLMVGLAVGMASCASLPKHQGPEMAAPQYVKVVPGYEAPGWVNAADFLGADKMHSPLYDVDEKAWNDGYANTYRIVTPRYVYVVQGTERAIERLHEIEVTEKLRHNPTVFAVGNAFKDKTINLAATPIRSIKYVGKRIGKIDSAEDAVMFVPSGIGDLISHTAHGLGELAFTTGRIIKGASGTKCAGVGPCLAKAGKEILSGTNSVLGKHEAARKFHRRNGTNPDTDNPVLQRQIDRLAYADAYAGALYKFGGSRAGVRFWSPTIRNVGYYNNAEFVLQYEDAYRQENREKDQVRSWGGREDLVKAFFSNPAFVRPTRTRLIKTLSDMGTPAFRLHMLDIAAGLKTRYSVDQQWQVLRILSGLQKRGMVSKYLDGVNGAIGVKPDGNLILPLSVDYLKWTPEIAALIDRLAASGRQVDVLVKGRVSDEFSRHVRQAGAGTVSQLPETGT